jgi:spore maturation protein CgeB
MGPAGHGEELTRIYSSDAIHVDIGRIYQSDIVTMRVFDVLACGGFCLAEWSEGLEDLFEVGVELDTWRTLEELLDKASFWLEAGAERRREVGRAGRDRVLRDHTIQQRLRRMIEA